MPNLFTDYNQFVEKIKTNTAQDIIDCRYRGETDPQLFKRYDVNSDVDTATYQQVSKQLVDIYVTPLMQCTGYRFPVRDYHKGGRKTKKITFMFICSQDRGKQRKSRSNDQRFVSNKLKIEQCESKITLNYSLHEGIVNLYYNHKAHSPYIWKKSRVGSDDEDDSMDHDSHVRSFDDVSFAEQFQQFQQIQPRNMLALQQQYQQQQAQAQVHAHSQHQNHHQQVQGGLQLPQIQQPYSPLGANSQQLQSLAQFSTQAAANGNNGQLQLGQFTLPAPTPSFQQQPPQLVSKQGSNGAHPTSPLDFALQAQQAEAAVAKNATVGQQHYQDTGKKESKVNVENIDKDLIGLNNE